MGTNRAWHGQLAIFAAIALAASGAAQHGTPPTTPPAQTPPAQNPPAQNPPAQTPPAQTPPAQHKRGSKMPPAHHPHPALPPGLLVHRLRAANETIVAARAAKQPLPPRQPRPAGAGRYVCAVFVCADADLDVAAVLGLPRRDVLVLSSPGPFVTREDIALLEHYVTTERLSLVLVLTHDECTTLTTKPGRTPRQDALAGRIAAIQKRADAMRHRLTRAVARSQREMLLASSRTLQQQAAADTLRVVAAEVELRSLAITWHTRSAEELPMPVVK